MMYMNEGLPSIDGAREAWRDYAELCRQDGIVYQRLSPAGAYVVDPMTKNGRIRKPVRLWA